MQRVLNQSPAYDRLRHDELTEVTAQDGGLGARQNIGKLIAQQRSRYPIGGMQSIDDVHAEVDAVMKKAVALGNKVKEYGWSVEAIEEKRSLVRTFVACLLFMSQEGMKRREYIEDNLEVYTRLAGMTDEEADELLSSPVYEQTRRQVEQFFDEQIFDEMTEEERRVLQQGIDRHIDQERGAA